MIFQHRFVLKKIENLQKLKKKVHFLDEVRKMCNFCALFEFVSFGFAAGFCSDLPAEPGPIGCTK